MLDLFGINEKEKVADEVIAPEAKITIFDYLTDITAGKRGNLGDKDRNYKNFNSFMILRFLSLDEGYLPLINVFNQWQGSLSKEEMYKTLLFIIPRKRKFLKYPKQIKSELDVENIKYLKDYFKCSEAEAEEFLKLRIITNSDIAKIKEAFGGKV